MFEICFVDNYNVGLHKSVFTKVQFKTYKLILITKSLYDYFTYRDVVS